MICPIGSVIKTNKSTIINDVGGTTFIEGTVAAEITESFYDYETGQRYIGKLINKKDIDKATKTGKTGCLPEYYKKYGDKLYQETLEANTNYNPKKVYFSEFSIL